MAPSILKNNTHTLEVKVTIDDDFIFDVMTTMVESSAISYWGMVNHVIRREGDKVVTEFQVMEDEHLNGRIHKGHTMRDIVDGSTGWYVIDTEAVLRGIKTALGADFLVAPYIREYIHKAVIEGDAGHIDEEAADAIVQAAMFDELVYG